MIRLKNVLVATDFSETSEAALEYGRELTRTFGAKLHVLHVADDIMLRYAFDGSRVLSPDVQGDFEAAARKRLEQLVGDDDRRELGAVAVLRTSNSPADSIVDYAREAGVDVIVAGTHARRADAHLLLGSVAERVVRTSPCPVLIVRHPEHEFLAPRRAGIRREGLKTCLRVKSRCQHRLRRISACAAIVFGLLICPDCSATSAPSLGASLTGTRSEVTVYQMPVADVAAAIQGAVGGDRSTALGLLTRAEREQLTTLYSADAFAPLWVDVYGHPNRDALDALTLLKGAGNEGLDPVDYRAPTLDALATALGATPKPLTSDIAAFDASLSLNTLRYLRQLHMGRVDPRAIGFRMTVPAEVHDFATLLRSALSDHRITEAAAELAPPLALYRALRGMLARYRSLAADPTLENPQPAEVSVRPGQPYTGLGTLHRWLVAVGDLTADVPAPAELSNYDGAIVEGVKRFQLRHGLDADGVLGKSTQAALRVPLAWRRRQIELALERLRWLPHLGQERFIAVNIPMFNLWGWDSIPANGAPAFGMGVIVGRALNTQTPVFVEEMRYLIFRPYWDIPASITRHEILPALERDPDYLRRQDMEIVAGPGDDAPPVVLTAETLSQIREGELRVRQRPGAKNALGLVKFVFPNDSNVYLHGTPAPELFGRLRRDFSHGCVRVEDPVALAEWALKDQDHWNRDRIVAAMNANQSRRVNLARPIQVILFYVTAVVMPEDGTIRFAEDIYRHDVKLDHALVQRRTTH